MENHLSRDRRGGIVWGPSPVEDRGPPRDEALVLITGPCESRMLPGQVDFADPVKVTGIREGD